MQELIKICCESGNRPHKLPFIKFEDFNDDNYLDYIESIYYCVSRAIKQKYNYFISGGALGVDLDFAQAVIDFRDGKMGEVQDIKLEIVLPCENYTKKWKNKDIVRFNQILRLADSVIVLNKNYTLECMQKRNEYMVDKSDLVLAFWNGENRGGTYNTINYAKKKNKNLEIINIKELLNI